LIVLDSSLLVAFHNTRDVHHDAAASTMERLVAGAWGRGLLLEYVFVEVVTVLLARRGLETASRVGGTLLDARELDFVPCSDVFLETLETFRTQGDRRLSFVDAAIVTVARNGGDGTVVATFDSDFDGIAGVSIVP
jgi:predicted nucleic acid-binding protein